MKKIEINSKSTQLKSLIALTKASFIAMFRNPSTVFFNFFFPFVFIIIFGSLNGDNAKFDVAVKENSLKEGPVYEALKNVKSLKLVEDKNNQEIEEDIKKGRIGAAIVISADTTSQMPSYKLDIEKSGANPTSAETITTIIEKVTQQINAYTVNNESQTKIVSLSSSVTEGRKFTQIDFILPGQLAFALLSNALFGMTFSLISLKKELVLKRIFATPTKKWVIMASQVLSKTLMAILQTLVIVLIGHFLFDFTLVQGVLTIFYMILISLIGMFTFLAFGLFVASVAKSEDAASPIANLIMMPQLFLSGAFFQIEVFPKFIQPIAHILPMTLLNELFKKVAFEGVAFYNYPLQILGILAWGLVFYLINIKLFKWE